MIVARLIVSGPNIAQEIFQECRARFDLRYAEAFGNVVIGASEAYFLRVNSNLLTLMAFQLCGVDRARIRIVTGGGGEGVLSVDWGAEKKRTKSMLSELAKICEAKGWTVADDREEEELPGRPSEEPQRATATAGTTCPACGASARTGSDRCQACGITFWASS